MSSLLHIQKTYPQVSSLRDYFQSFQTVHDIPRKILQQNVLGLILAHVVFMVNLQHSIQRCFELVHNHQLWPKQQDRPDEDVHMSDTVSLDHL